MSALDELTGHDWPGNVRELANVIERAVIASDGATLALPKDFAKSAPRKAAADPFAEAVTLVEMERRYIEHILQRVKGQVAGPGGAAEILGMHPNTLHGRMKKIGVCPVELASSAE
jgi:DNA-binding NtrC family response regulator